MSLSLRLFALGVVLAAATVAPLCAQDPGIEMDNYVVAFLRGPADSGRGADPIAAAQSEAMRRLDRTGLLVVEGPVRGTDDIRQMLVFRTDSVHIARELVETLPVVRAGRYTVELHPWYSAAALGARRRTLLRAHPDTTLPVVPMQLVFLTRGKTWTPERTPEVEAIQAGHMENISRLVKEGTLVIAGPFTDGGTLRGIFVFRTSGVEEAARLTATDPAVSAGRLAVTLYEWDIPESVIP